MRFFRLCKRSTSEAQKAPSRPDVNAALPARDAPSFFTPSYATPTVPETTVTDILKTVAPYTMVHYTGIEFLIHETVRLIQLEIPGVIVECGVWRGGAALASLLAQRAAFGCVKRPVYLLDSFEGLPPVTLKDGPLAEAWQRGDDVERFMDNCRAAETACRNLLLSHGFEEQEARIFKGWFKDTLPTVQRLTGVSSIALLRLDGDWYNSTIECLEALEPSVSEEGTIIIDDYYAWDGCARAVHDYLSAKDLPYRIKSLYGNYGAYMIKRKFRDSYEKF